MQAKMVVLETELANARNVDMEKLLHQYGDLQEKFARRDGYVIDSEIDNRCRFRCQL